MQQARSHKDRWLWRGQRRHLSPTWSPARDSGQLPQHPRRNLPFLALNTPVSLQTLKMGRACLPTFSAEPAPWALVCIGGWSHASFLCFCLHIFFFLSPLPQHPPLQTLGPAFSFGSLPKKMLKLWCGQGHSLLGISWDSPHLMDENTEASQGPDDVPKATGQ